MNQQMTIEDIRSQFESEWILIEDPETNDALEVLSGKVVHHSRDRDEVYRKAVSLRPTRSAVVYTGEIPEGTAVVLCARPSTRSGASSSSRPSGLRAASS